MKVRCIDLRRLIFFKSTTLVLACMRVPSSLSCERRESRTSLRAVYEPCSYAFIDAFDWPMPRLVVASDGLLRVMMAYDSADKSEPMQP